MFRIDRINQYRFYKLNVSTNLEWKYGECDRIINSVIALHSARIGKPYISLINKGCADSVQTLYKHINFSNQYAYVRCMRKTLHLCTLKNLKILHYATKSIRISSKYEQINAKMIRYSQEYLKEILDNVYMEPQILYEKLIRCMELDIYQVRNLLKYHWENGLICLCNSSDVFYKEKRLFTLTRSQYNVDLLGADLEEDYITRLVEMYILQYGPVSFKDILWWTGLPKTRLLTSLQNLRERLIELEVSGLNYNLILHKSQWESFNLYKNEYEWCRLMGYEDCVMKGYMQTRFFYSENYKNYFNKIGEIYSTIVYNGECVGIWEIDNKIKDIVFKIDLNSKIDRQLLRQEIVKTKKKLFMEEIL